MVLIDSPGTVNRLKKGPRPSVSVANNDTGCFAAVEHNRLYLDLGPGPAFNYVDSL